MSRVSKVWQGAVILVALGVSLWAASTVFPPGESERRPAPKPTGDQYDTRWTTFEDATARFRIDYPDNLLMLSQEGPRVTLSHSIPHRHPDPCNLRGDQPAILETLTDFHVQMEVIGTGFRETVTSRQDPQFVQEYLFDDRLKTVPGFIDEVRIDSLRGYLITMGAEGCGVYEYYFALTETDTLVVERSFIPEFQPIVAGHEEYLRLPGIIRPEEERRLFNKIMSTFRLLE
jgi:hypothetical protein